MGVFGVSVCARSRSRREGCRRRQPGETDEGGRSGGAWLVLGQLHGLPAMLGRGSQSVHHGRGSDRPVIINALAPKGRLHVVGAVPEPIPVAVFSLLSGQKAISGSPLGSPATTAKMLAFCARHHIAPTIEKFPMSRVNEALEHLRAGKARYRIVLENDFE